MACWKLLPGALLLLSGCAFESEAPSADPATAEAGETTPPGSSPSDEERSKPICGTFRDPTDPRLSIVVHCGALYSMTPDPAAEDPSWAGDDPRQEVAPTGPDADPID